MRQHQSAERRHHSQPARHRLLPRNYIRTCVLTVVNNDDDDDPQMSYFNSKKIVHTSISWVDFEFQRQYVHNPNILARTGNQTCVLAIINDDGEQCPQTSYLIQKKIMHISASRVDSEYQHQNVTSIWTRTGNHIRTCVLSVVNDDGKRRPQMSYFNTQKKFVHISVSRVDSTY